MWAAMLWSASAQTLTDIGATAPTPGANDISQLSTSGNQTNPNGLNYYTDNQTGHGTGEPGQTFTTGNNAAGYILSTVSIKTAGLGSYSGISTSQPYYLHIYSVSGGNATVLQTYTSANITFNDGDWLQWSGLSVALSPNATYAYSFGKASSTNGWEALAVATNNPYACGEIGLVPTSGGAITFGSSHGFDAVFDLGLAPALAPVVSLLAVLPMNTVLVGTPVTFTASVAGAQPLYWQWQFNSGSGYANIPGAITNTMGFTAAVTNNGLYQLILTNSYGAVTSAPVTLSVILNPTNEPNNDNVIIYNGQAILSSGWQNWSYGGATLNFTNTTPVTNTTPNLQFPGIYSLSASLPNGGTIQLENGNSINGTLYSAFTFWANGGTSGGQDLKVAASNNGSQGTQVSIGPLPANSWQQYTVTLSALGMANATNLNFFSIINSSGSTLPVFYLEGISLTAKAPPATVHVGVNAYQTVRTVDPRVFGINAADWDGYINTPTTLSILTNLNNQVLRWPGGSGADVYFMSNSTSLANTRNFIQVATNTHAQVFFTVNYGTGTPQQAAAWVAFCNITNHCGFKYWEVGNESGGTWETDSNTVAPYQPHDPWTYAIRFKQYYTAMKAVDPTIKIGSSADVTEDGTANYSNHPVVNPVTGVTHNGWTPVMLYTMRTNGCICDFLIDHTYGPGNSDIGGLTYSPVWKVNANNLRTMLTDYLGGPGANVELNVTENGSGGNDRQLVSVVSGLFWCDNLGQLLQTEFNTRLWWDLRNGTSDYSPSDNSLYGWRKDSNTGSYFGDLGIVSGLGNTAVNCYPDYYCGKLLTHFASGGDTVITATNDFPLLAAYAVQRTNGSLTLLVINKSCYTNLNATINLTGFVPATSAIAYSYGLQQDMVASLNGPAAAMDIATNNLLVTGTNFTATFQPYMATVLQFAPAALPPMATSTTVSPSASVYSGQNALLSANASGPGPLSYQWQFGDGINWTNLPGATTNSVVVNPQAVGTIYYQLTVANSFGAVTNTPISIMYNVLPTTPAGLWTANFQITNNLFQNIISTGIGNYVGRGILGNGTNWNIIPDYYAYYNVSAINLASVSDWQDDGVTHSGISASVNTAYGYSSQASPLAARSDIGNLLDQYVQIYTGAGALTFTGLPNGTYNLALYGADGSYANRGTTFVIHDSQNGNQSKSTLNAAPQTALAQGNNFVLFTNVHVSGGSLIVDINANPSAHGGGNTEADFNAAQIQLVSYDPPVAGFSGGPTNIFVTQSVTFTNTSIGIITNSTWNFGDGAFATNYSIAGASHNYAGAGAYTVHLTASGPGGMNTATQTNYVTVSPMPVIGGAYLTRAGIVFSGTNAPAGVSYRILAATNVALPLASWTPVATNVVAPDGSYSYTNSTLTNAENFFRLVSP
jgi:PKD repeat protein